MQMDVLHFNNPNLLSHFCNLFVVSESLTDIGRHWPMTYEHPIAFKWPYQRLY